MAVSYSVQSAKTSAAIGTVICVAKPSTWSAGSDDWELSRYPGWLECDGTSLDPNNYYALYQVIGTTYGGSVSGTYPNFSGTFKLPNYRGRFVVGTGKVDGNVASSGTLTPNASPDGSAPIDVNHAGSIGGVYVINDIRQQNPTQDDTFEIVSKRSRGFENVTAETQVLLSGNVTQNFGPLGATPVYSAPPHTHQVIHTQLSNRQLATSSDGGPSSGDRYPCMTNTTGNISSWRRRVENSSPSSSPSVRKHSHKINANSAIVGRTWGHDEEGGNTGATSGAPSDLGNTASKTITVADMGLEVNTSTFTMSQSSTVRTLFDSRVVTTLTSAETLSMMQYYHRNKYLIKAI